MERRKERGRGRGVRGRCGKKKREKGGGRMRGENGGGRVGGGEV